MKRWTVPLVLAACLCVFVIVFSHYGSPAAQQDLTCDHASFRTNEWGTKAFRELLERSHLPTQTLDRPWTQLGDDVRVLWVIDPQTTPTRAELERLVAWVKRGGLAVFAPDPREERRGIGIAPAARGNQRMLARLGLEAAGAAQPAALVSVRSTDPLVRDVSRVHVPTELRLRARRSDRVSVEAADDADDSEAPVQARHQRRLVAAAVEAVVADKTGIVVGRLRLGRGQLIVLCDADMLANSKLSSGDNVILAANLAFAGRGATVWFDEFHHGRRSAEAAELDTAGPTYALWAIIAALALYLAGKFCRFGSPLPAEGPSRRSALEHVRAFASLFRRAGHRQAVLEMIVSRFRGRLAGVGGVRAQSPPETLAAAVSRRHPRLDEAQVAGLLARCATALTAASPPSELEMLELVRAISRIEQELAFHDS